MRNRITLEETSVPRLPRHIRLRDDTADASPARVPECLLAPDSLALEVLRHCDGRSTVGDIVDHVSRKLETPRESVAPGIHALLQDLADGGFLTA